MLKREILRENLRENNAHTGMPPLEDSKTTGELMHILTGTHTPKELDAYLETHTLPDTCMDFAGCFQHFLEIHDLKKSDIIRTAQLDRTYGYQILSGARQPGRDKILALCIAAGLTLRETQRCLECAGEGILYARSSRDAVIIYGIEHHIDVMRMNELLADKKERMLE